MNDIEQVMASLTEAHPEASFQLTGPANSDGVWWLDIITQDSRLVVEWSPKTNFSVTTPDTDSYGENADESYLSVAKVLRRIDQLLVNEDRTSPPLSILLARLREMRGFTQQQLASKLGIRQASISGFERRNDMQISTLRRLIQALGGCVQIFAEFPEGRFSLDGSEVEEGLNFTAVANIGSAKRLITTNEPDQFEGEFARLTCAGKKQRALDVARLFQKNQFVFEIN